MSIKIESTMTSAGHQETETRDFVSTLAQTCILLDTLAQLQAAVGGLSMQGRANLTFEIHARLENYLNQIKHNAGMK